MSASISARSWRGAAGVGMTLGLIIYLIAGAVIALIHAPLWRVLKD